MNIPNYLVSKHSSVIEDLRNKSIIRKRNGKFVLSIPKFFKYLNNVLNLDSYLAFSDDLVLDDKILKCFFEQGLVNDNVGVILHYLPNSNLYLYLLNIIYDLPKSYQDIVSSFNLSSLLDGQNDKAIEYIFNSKFVTAYLNYHKKDSIDDNIIKCLLNKTIDIKEQFRRDLLILARDERYEEILVVIKNCRYPINDYEKSLILLVNSLLTNNFSKDVRVVSTYLEAILYGEYEYARFLIVKDSDDVLNCLLARVIAKNYREESLAVKLRNFDFISALKIIEQKLVKIDKKRYLVLFRSLISISLIEHDFEFSNLLNEFDNILNHNYFVKGRYILAFNKCIIKDDAIKYLEFLKFIVSKDEFRVLKANFFNRFYKNDEDYKVISNKKLLMEKGLIVMPRYDYYRNKRIVNLASNFDYIHVSSIFYDNHEQVFIQYQDFKNVNCEQLISKSKKAYSNGDFVNCLKYNRMLLESGYINRANYLKVGFSYLNLKDNVNAYDYLLVAQYMKNDNKYDLYSTLSYLKIAMIEESVKKNILSYSLESIKSSLGLSDEDVGNFLLKLAKEYYVSGNSKKGDRCLSLSEKIDDKSLVLKKNIEMVKKNKKLLLNS